jgi:hypothetical protein
MGRFLHLDFARFLPTKSLEKSTNDEPYMCGRGYMYFLVRQAIPPPQTYSILHYTCTLVRRTQSMPSYSYKYGAPPRANLEIDNTIVEASFVVDVQASYLTMKNSVSSSHAE